MLANIRTFSNKENTAFALPHPITSAPLSRATASSTGSAASKPRITGIGRAPSKRAHAAKPYERQPSVDRAKLRATSPEKRATRTVKARSVRASPTQSEKQKVIGSQAAPVAGPSALKANPPPRVANIPLRLPKPDIPPVTHIPGVAAHVPIDYTMYHLRRHLPALLLVSSQYLPQPQLAVPTPPGEIPRLAFGITKVMLGDSEMEAKIRGREPDICLALSGRGQQGVPERLVSVSSIVYAAQCSHWSSLCPSSAPPAPATPTSTAAGPSTSSVLPTIAEDNEEMEPPREAPADEEGNGEGDADADASFASDYTFTSSSSRLTACTTSSDRTATSSHTPGLLHLPLRPITLPHLPSFATLHTHLHLPDRPLLPVLLGLPGTCSSPEEAKQILATASTPVLMARLEWMHGFWSNVCALGIAAERTWVGMMMAWGAVVDVLISRSAKVGPPA